MTSLKTPVLIVPGVLGTNLKKGDDLLWANSKMTILPDSFMDPLSFSEDLQPTDNDILTSEVIRKTTFLGHGLDYTDGLINEFVKQGYLEGQDLFTFPYDWRYGISGVDAEGNLVNLNAFQGQIDYILTQTESGKAAGKVNIVAHSTGGLLVKQYLYTNKLNSKLGKTVMVGVPNSGAPKAYKVIIEGDNFDVPGLNPKEMKKLAQNMPVLYDLAPTRNYYEGSFLKIHNPLASTPEEVDSQPTYDQAIAEFKKLNLINDKALAASEVYHGTLDSFSVPYKTYADLYTINGCATATLGGITETISKFSEPAFDFPKLITGDGTVPTDSSGGIIVPANHLYWALKTSHGQLLSADGIRQHIVNLISGSQLDTGNAVLDEDAFNENQKVCDLKGKWWHILSPVNIEVTDAEGHRTGLAENGSVENGIPGSDMEIFGDHKYVYVPQDQGQTYTVKLQGTGEGNFTFKEYDVSGSDAQLFQIYENIPVTEKFQGSIILADGLTEMAADYDGDGSVDQLFTPENPEHIVPAPKPDPEPTPAPSGGGGSPAVTILPVTENPGKVLGANTFQDGSLVLDSNDGRTVYLVYKAKKYGFVSDKVFLGLGYKFSNLVKNDLTIVDTGAVIDSIDRAHPDGSIVQDGQTVSLISQGKRFPILNMNIFRSMGLNLKDLVRANKHDKTLEIGAL
ncbi:MAG: hypothetical protein KW788_01180 [Candidatus Doudnabacteria bacterium]|nr:hypothetical protein [Candidatus Doudnabacteria bacterium]